MFFLLQFGYVRSWTFSFSLYYCTFLHVGVNYSCSACLQLVHRQSKYFINSGCRVQMNVYSTNNSSTTVKVLYNYEDNFSPVHIDKRRDAATCCRLLNHIGFKCVFSISASPLVSKVTYDSDTAKHTRLRLSHGVRWKVVLSEWSHAGLGECSCHIRTHAGIWHER